MNRGPRTKIATGIYADKYGVSVEARLGRGLRSPELRFPLGTPESTLIAVWHREKMKLNEALQKVGGPIVRGTLAADVLAYFKTAKLSPQRRQERQHQCDWWCIDQGFGSRDRHTLDHVELTQALNSLHGRSASTINKYRTALSNLFTVLDGKNAKNPFRDVAKEDEGEAARRDQPYELIQAIMAKLRDRGQGKALSRTKAWLRVLAYCPVTAAQLKLMRRGDVHWNENPVTVSVPGRRKGGGTRGQRKELQWQEGCEAFRAFEAAGCWGPDGRVRTPHPSRSSRLKTFKLARNKAIAELRETRPDLDLSRAAEMLVKDLRHSFLTLVLRLTGDLSATQLMADHLDSRTTLRYAQGAVAGVLQQASAKLATGFAAIPPYVPPVELPRSASALGRDAAGQSGTLLAKTRLRGRPRNRAMRGSLKAKVAI